MKLSDYIKLLQAAETLHGGDCEVVQPVFDGQCGEVNDSTVRIEVAEYFQGPDEQWHKVSEWAPNWNVPLPPKTHWRTCVLSSAG